MASVSSPSARVSLIPAAHLLIVLKVAGATTMASGGGSTAASSGCLYCDRTGWPVAASRAAWSMKLRPLGVAITHTSQPSAWASSTRRPVTGRRGAADDEIQHATARVRSGWHQATAPTRSAKARSSCLRPDRSRCNSWATSARAAGW
jgi:hypothetical protein